MVETVALPAEPELAERRSVQVAAIDYAVLKGAALRTASSSQIGPAGLADDRRFVLFDREATQFYAHRSPRLCAVDAVLQDGRLTIRLPGGEEAQGPVVHGRALGAEGWDEIVRHGAVVQGPFAGLLSRHLRRPVELLDLEGWSRRGVDVEPVTLISTASIGHLAARLGLEALDHRRFRANLILASAERPHQEDEWIGTEIRVGDVRLRVIGPIPRCAVITRDPDTGARDADTLREIRRYRGVVTMDSGERGIPFGVYARVVSPGRVAVGDAVRAGSGSAV
jgi:uncharacterized protein YcbX